ncbi:MAG: hypothetical protein ACT4PL_09385 [Phycisphaerales bacterium]
MGGVQPSGPEGAVQGASLGPAGAGHIGTTLCTGCGADVSGAPLDGFCGQCGTAMVSTIVARGVVVDRSLPCLTCGYDLQGLAADGVCSECGTSVGRSLHGNYLRYSSRAHVSRLKLGVDLALLSVVCKVLVIFAVGGVTVAAGMNPARVNQPWVQLLTAILQAGAVGLQLAGWWLISTPSVANVASDKSQSTRQWLRVVLIMNAAFIAGTVLVAALQISMVSMIPGGQGTFIGVSMGLSVVVWVVESIQWFTSMRYTSHLAKRLPSKPLESFSITLMWLVFLRLICGLGDLALFVLNIILLVRMRNALTETLRIMPKETL